MMTHRHMKRSHNKHKLNHLPKRTRTHTQTHTDRDTHTVSFSGPYNIQESRAKRQNTAINLKCIKMICCFTTSKHCHFIGWPHQCCSVQYTIPLPPPPSPSVILGKVLSKKILFNTWSVQILLLLLLLLLLVRDQLLHIHLAQC